MDFKSFRKEILSGNGSVKELIGDFFKKIDSSNQNLNAYICTTKEKALSQANLIDKKITNKDQLPLLTGIPISIKDNLCTKDISTTLSQSSNDLSLSIQTSINTSTSEIKKSVEQQKSDMTELVKSVSSDLTYASGELAQNINAQLKSIESLGDDIKQTTNQLHTHPF